MACLIQGIQLAKGEFFLPFDSDDESAIDALQVFSDEYNKIPDDKKKCVSGITCMCKDQDGNVYGEKFKSSPLYSSTFNNILNNWGQVEKWGFIKTDILKGITVNPNIFSNGYIPEGILWNLLSKHNLETVYINNVLRTYYLDTENRVSNADNKRDAYGMAIYSLAIINWFYKDYFVKNPKLFLKRFYTLLRASHFLNFSKSDYLTALDSNMFKFFLLLGWPFKRFLK